MSIGSHCYQRCDISTKSVCPLKRIGGTPLFNTQPVTTSRHYYDFDGYWSHRQANIKKHAHLDWCTADHTKRCNMFHARQVPRSSCCSVILSRDKSQYQSQCQVALALILSVCNKKVSVIRISNETRAFPSRLTSQTKVRLQTRLARKTLDGEMRRRSRWTTRVCAGQAKKPLVG